MKSVVEKGTATYVKVACNKPGYTLYAKTGTTGNALQNYSSKRLFVAIVKDDPGGIPVDFKSKRKFFVYVTLDKAYKGDKENPWYQAIFTSVVNRVMDSRSFKEFMR
jgi:cell division protein FtsI/penicillin-binding protein 2